MPSFDNEIIEKRRQERVAETWAELKARIPSVRENPSYLKVIDDDIDEEHRRLQEAVEKGEQAKKNLLRLSAKRHDALCEWAKTR